jgi:AraC family transcriptional regulator of adaptative response/methylated-DNA-[protein]-cysteine methyltransferase
MNMMIDPAPILSEPTQARDYRRIAAAIRYVLEQRPRQPALDEVAGHVGLSPFHLQRLFKRWAGVSPKQFMGFLTLEHAKTMLRRSEPVLDAALDAGLSGPSRLHDLFVTHEAMTPGEYASQGASLVIRHGVAETPFGSALILVTYRGICGIEFIDGDPGAALAAARAQWPLSRLVADDTAAATVAEHLASESGPNPMRLLLRGTNFQIQVWSALLRIPSGTCISYGEVARRIHQPNASRAVGAALSRNPIAYLVPCHRVLRGTGLFQAYKWSPERRLAILAWEEARSAAVG